MPISVRIDIKQGVVFRVIKGSVTVDEIIESFSSVLKDDNYRPGMKTLTDMREVVHSATPEDVKRIAGFILEQMSTIGSLKAAVVVSTDVSFGMTQILRALVDRGSTDIRVFRDMEEAMSWLQEE